MSVSTSRPTVGDLIDSFTQAPPDRVYAEYQRLVGALWNAGTLTDLAPIAAPALAARLAAAGTERQGHIAVLLGLLVEAERAAEGPRGPQNADAVAPAAAGPISAAVRDRLDAYLDLWRRGPSGRPLSLALLYLLSHFPGDRDRILAVAATLDIEPNDLSRLDRALRQLDPDNPVLGRVFPSPYVWRLLDDAEREFDQSWIKALTPEQIRQNWRNDTRTVLGHSGAKAYWAVRNGAPEAVVTPPLPPRDSLRVPVPDPDVDAFARHAAAFRCPDCAGGLAFETGAARCTGCATEYPIVRGILNLAGGPRGGGNDFLYKLAEVPSMGLFYEAYARPAFLRVSGSNWGGQVTPSDEDGYIAEHVRPVGGPVLDLAAGAGRWTQSLAKAVGPERVIALDLYPPMLAALRARVPQVPAVMASARTLPFGDATLGAVLCWNALQAFPQDAPAAIAEVGRCLRPGGTFSILTFRMSADPVYRYFQASHHLPGHPTGLRLFELDELKDWLAKAGLAVRAESGPGTFVLITAERLP